MITPMLPGDDDQEFSRMAEAPDGFASLSPDPEPEVAQPPLPAATGQSGLEIYLSKLPPHTREAVLKRARKQGFSDTDPIWEIVLAVRERDEDFKADILKAPIVITQAVAELHSAIKILESTANAEKAVAKRLEDANSFQIKESDWHGKLLIGQALGLVLILVVALWGSWEVRTTRAAADSITETLAATDFNDLVEQLKRANRQMELVRNIQIVTNRRQELLFQENTIDREIVSLQRSRAEGRLTAEEETRAKNVAQRQEELAVAWGHLSKLEDDLRSKINAFNSQ